MTTYLDGETTYFDLDNATTYLDDDCANACLDPDGATIYLDSDGATTYLDPNNATTYLVLDDAVEGEGKVLGVGGKSTGVNVGLGLEEPRVAECHVEHRLQVANNWLW